MEIQNGADSPVNKPARIYRLASAAAAALTILLTGCGPGRPAVDTYLASVTNASPAQADEDGQFIAKLFAEQAAQHGLVLEKRLAPNAIALYFPGPAGLNLSLSVLRPGERSIAIAIIPVALGRKDNSGCRAVIAAVDQTLQKNFGNRLVKAP
jgi:hypothetical protein